MKIINRELWFARKKKYRNKIVVVYVVVYEMKKWLIVYIVHKIWTILYDEELIEVYMIWVLWYEKVETQHFLVSEVGYFRWLAHCKCAL